LLQQGSDRMRQEQRSITAELSAVDFRFHFQMTNAGGRHACTVAIRAPSEADASAIFRANWFIIEDLARRGLAEENRREIRLEPAGR
jgi:hypothetical protein